jgi:hypothetical protein
MMNCPSNTGKTLVALALLLLPFATALTLQAPPAARAADATQSAPEKGEEQRLIGRWVRPDGGYVLELKEIGKDGALQAAYFNPRPINVAQAELSRKDGALALFVELRDVNYPGSTYNLRYDPETDRLIGTYFQAVYGETYRIEFMRAK